MRSVVVTRLRLGLSGLLCAGAAVAIVGAPSPASAAPPGCGYRVGAVFVNRGAGGGGFDVPLIPDTPGQACSVTVAATATITLAGGARPANVAHDPSAGTVTLTFSPFATAPRVTWQWGPFCADPPTVTFTATIGGLSGAVAVGANSCESFGGSSTLGPPALLPAQPAFTSFAPTPSGGGLWGAEATGAVKAAGDATNLGGTSALAAPVVGMSRTPSGHGYWLVGSDGGIFTFGDAAYEGSTGAMRLNAPVVGMAATLDGGGYWLVAADGGIFTFGDAHFFGSTGALRLNQPVVGMAATPDGGGYWLVAADGGIFTFGDAHFFGSTGALRLNQPVVGMAATPDGGGYWLVAADGGIFTFGDAAYEGSGASAGPSAPAAAVAPTPSGKGYWVLVEDGNVIGFGDAPLLSLLL
jgi:hypothetical protein